MTHDEIDENAVLQEIIDADKRICSTPEYRTTEAATLDLDEQERIRYLYIEREMILKFQASERWDPETVPTLRSVAHDEAIRQVAAVRIQGAHAKVAWEDVTKTDE